MASSDTLSIGSNYSDAGVKKAFADRSSAWEKTSGKKATVNTVDHNTFQNKIQNYLQGTPDDVFSLVRRLPDEVLRRAEPASPIDDVWDKIGANFPDSIKAASKGDDGHYYFVPLYNYPWVMCYRKSVLAAKGYQVPATWDDLIALCKQMQTDGLHADLLRRQGRLAGDGHVRHPQHAHERLPVPRRPDGAQASPGPTPR